MIKFEVLGEVAAREDGWKADLKPQQQLMLARLVIANGAMVPWYELDYALEWDADTRPARGFKGVAHDLRAALNPEPPTKRMPPYGRETTGYKFPLESEEQADILRFRAAVTVAHRASGDGRARLMRAARTEWGPAAAGLFGGHPLNGLNGTWAESTRNTLRNEYRNVVMECLKQDMVAGRHQLVMRQCGQLGDDSEALDDREFVALWMLATYRSSQPTWAHDIFRKAADYARRTHGQEPDRELRDLAESIRTGNPELKARGGLADFLAGLGCGVPAAAPIQARRISQPVESERTAVTEPGITFHIGDNASVGSAIARNEGHVTIHMGAAAKPVAGDAGDIEPNGADRICAAVEPVTGDAGADREE